MIYKASPNWSSTIGTGGVPNASTTTIPLSTASGLTEGAYYIMTIDRVDASGQKTPAKKETVAGQLSGTNLVNCQRGVEGVAQAHSQGAVVEMLFTAKHWSELENFLLVEHNPDGTHKFNLDTIALPQQSTPPQAQSGKDVLFVDTSDNLKYVKPDNNVEEVVRTSGAQTILGTKTFSTSPILNNNVALQSKKSDNSVVDLLKLDSSNILAFAGMTGISMPNDVGFLKSKVLSTTRDMSSTESFSITGVGFKPSTIICIATTGWDVNVASIGFSDSSGGARCIRYQSSNTWSFVDRLASLRPSNGIWGLNVSSYDSDGASFSVVRESSPTGTAYLQFLFLK